MQLYGANIVCESICTRPPLNFAVIDDREKAISQLMSCCMAIGDVAGTRRNNKKAGRSSEL